jgi:hypothetical protein
VAALALTACDPVQVSEGVPGETGVALFDAPTTLVFENRLLVGSTFVVSVTARRADDLEQVSASELVSSDEDILAIVVEPVGDGGPTDSLTARVTLVGPGEASIEVRDGSEKVDAIAVKAAHAVEVEVYDEKLLSEQLDARLPDEFGVVDGRDTRLAIGAVDQCGAPLIALDATTATWSTADALALPVKAQEGTTAIVLSPDTGTGTGATVEGTLTLTSPGFEDPITRGISVFPRSAVDEVDIAIASGDGTNYLVWGRAFVDDFEVIGLDYSWGATARVTLSVAEGPWNSAEVAQPAQGEPADTREVKITAEVFGVEQTLDLQSPATAEVGRLPPVETTEPSLSGCGETNTCDPYAAFLPGLLWLGRLHRRKRTS